MSRIFISYNHVDQDTVRDLVEDLEELEHEVWFDQALSGGQSWWDKILSNIRSCDFFILAVSPDSLSSDACTHELSYVQKLGKTILPVLLSDQVNLSLLPPPLNKIQVMDYCQQDKKAAFALIKAIAGLSDSKPLPVPLPEAPSMPVSDLSTLREQIEQTESLKYKQQLFLVSKIRASLDKKGCPPSEVQELLQLMKHQDGLLAKIEKEIDDVLNHIDKGDKTPKNNKTSASEKLKTTTLSDTKTRRFVYPPEHFANLISDLENWLDAQNDNYQRLNAENWGMVLQLAQKGSWRKFVEMATSLNIVFRHTESRLDLEIGAGKWIDKAAVGTVSLFVFWTLALTAGIGARQQMKLPHKSLTLSKIDWSANNAPCYH